jgi:hypothetical protein
MNAMRAPLPLLCLTLVACGGSGDENNQAQNFIDYPPLWNEYVIGYGETLNLAEGVSLEFTSVAEDSRCPLDVQCVSAGNARVVLKTITPRGESSVSLNTDPALPDSALFDYYGVELRKLEPFPGAGAQNGSVPVPLNLYEATVFVVRAATPPG